MATRDISERHEIRIEGEKSVFVFAADSEDGKLVIRQIRKRGGDKEVCSLTLADPGELEDFFEGLRRVLRATEPDQRAAETLPPLAPATRPKRPSRKAAPSAQRPLPFRERGPAAAPPLASAVEEEERERVIEKARERNPKAFEPWTPREEIEIRDAFRSGAPIEEIARRHRRSPRAIEMRLRRMGEQLGVGDALH